MSNRKLTTAQNGNVDISSDELADMMLKTILPAVTKAVQDELKKAGIDSETSEEVTGNVRSRLNDEDFDTLPAGDDQPTSKGGSDDELPD